MTVKTVQQVSFAPIFRYAEEEYGIHWNPCNDLFFNNCFKYNQISDVHTLDWQEYFDSDCKRASEIPNDIVLGLEDEAKGYIILCAYLESQGVTGEVQVDSR